MQLIDIASPTVNGTRPMHCPFCKKLITKDVRISSEPYTKRLVSCGNCFSLQKKHASTYVLVLYEVGGIYLRKYYERRDECNFLK